MAAADAQNHPLHAGVVPEERRRLIAERLREAGSISVAAVEATFSVSAMTARRDLTILEREGRARRTHGGAVLPALSSHEDSFQHRLEQDVQAKVRLAAACLPLIERNETVFADCSSSAYYAMRALLQTGAPVTILTNSVPIITLAASQEHLNAELVGIGGTFRRLTQSFVGPDAVSAIRGYLADVVVLSAKGITAAGSLTDPDPLEAEVKRSMIQQASTTVLLASAQKFHDRGVSVIAELPAVDIAVLADAPPEAAQRFAAAGVRVISA